LSVSSATVCRKKLLLLPGGPIVLKGSSQVWVRGHIVGFDAGLNESYGHKWTTVRDLWGVTIVTAS
jgi:hypothetical protein